MLGGGRLFYEREFSVPSYYSELKKFDINSISIPLNIIEHAYKLIGLPNICSKKWIYNQYDSMVGTVNMSTKFTY